MGLAFVSPVSGAPQGDPCDGNPCGENNICTSNGGAVSCECAPGMYIIFSYISEKTKWGLNLKLV